MPFNKFFGKNKEDLVLLATLGRVLTSKQAEEMTQPDLAAFLFEKEQELEAKSTPQKIKKSREKTSLGKKQKEKETSPVEENVQESSAPLKEKPAEKLSKRELNKRLFMLELATKNNPDGKTESTGGPQLDSTEKTDGAVLVKTKGRAKGSNPVEIATNINKKAKKAVAGKKEDLSETKASLEPAGTDSKPDAAETGNDLEKAPEAGTTANKHKSKKSKPQDQDNKTEEKVPDTGLSSGQEPENKPEKEPDKKAKSKIARKKIKKIESVGETALSVTVDIQSDAALPTTTDVKSDIEEKIIVETPADTGEKTIVEAPADTEEKTIAETPADTTSKNIIETPLKTANETASAVVSEEKKETASSEKHHRHINKASTSQMPASQPLITQPSASQPSINPDDSLADSIPIEEGEKKKHEKVPPPEVLEMVEGALEIMPDGYGFLRKTNYLQGPKDIYIPPQYIRRFGLRPGDWITGPGKLQRETDRYQAILYIKEVNGLSPEKMIGRPQFDQLTPIYPDERFILETVKNELSTRIIDLVAPIGKGQRGMIVSPPKAGKTILLQKIANAISTNNPETKLIVLLIDERPEEVTDMQRSINGEVVYSTFDKTPENHVKVVELVLERAMRLVELGQDVVILLDSITRLARAYNLTINPTGRTLSGGLDPGALYGPKRFFGSARNIENGGSLTIIATSLIDTGSRMDEVIFEEFKGTGNMEVYLDRKLSEKRIFPAIDLNRSGTRREELLLSKRELDAVWTIRKAFGQLDTAAVTEMIINLLLKTNHNSHFVSSVNVSLNDKAMFDAMRGTKPGGSNQGNNNNTNSNGNNYSSSNSF